MTKLVTLVFTLLLFGCANSYQPECTDVTSCGAKIRSRIMNNFVIHEGFRGLEAKVHFVLNSSAGLESYTLIQSSGVERFDSEVKSSVENSFPYPELLNTSAEVYQEVREIELTVSL